MSETQSGDTGREPAAAEVPAAGPEVEEVLELGPAAGQALGQRIAGMVAAEEQRVAAEEQLEEEEVPEEPPHDPRTRRCQVCAGWGIVRTGSIVEGNVTRQCRQCGGQGYEEAQLVGPPTPLVSSDQVEPAEEAAPAGAWVWPQAVE